MSETLLYDNICDICTNAPENCNNLHIFYLIGSILTMCGCLFVISTYIYNSSLREHPAVLIASRCLFDFLFGLCFFVQYFLPIKHLACQDKHCDILGALILFCFLCSQGYFAASIRDLYTSLKNPFSQPHKDVTKVHIFVILISATITIFVSLQYAFSYRIDLQYCAIKPSKSDINPYNLAFIYIPISSLILISVSVNIYAIKRLRVGLEDTFYVRMVAIKDGLFYCLGYTFYFLVLGICYFLVWNDDIVENDSYLKDETGAHYLYSLTVAFLGLNDCGLWIYRQFRMYKTKNFQEEKQQYAKIAQVESLNRHKNNNEINKIEKQIRRNKTIAKQFIAPALPEHIAYVDSNKNNSNKSNNNQCAQFCKRLSFKPTIGDQSINKALRREVLAYTTDGIAQSVDRQSKSVETYYYKTNLKLRDGLHDEDFPININDKHGRTIQRFNIVIKHNKYLLYENPNDDHDEDDDDDDTDDDDDKNDDIKSDNDNNALSPSSVAGGVQRVSTKLIIEGDDTGIGKEREFIDFAPIVFKYIRNCIIGISDESYNRSIIPSSKSAQRNVLDAKYGEGKSGAFFYFTHDSRYLVKTIKKFEVEVMLNTLKKYVQYIDKNPNTILSRVVGLHAIRLYGLTKYFVVSENIFLSSLKPSEVYDLKGSWVGRYTKYSIQSGKTLKDGDLKRFIVLNKTTREQLINQLTADSKFLSSCQIMDYSLLLGIYHLKMAPNNIDNNNDDDDDAKYINIDDENQEKAALNNYAGGIRAEIIEGPGLYYMGIIDTLQPYNWKKKMETFLKTYILRDDGNGISCVEPSFYQTRFMNYMKNIVVTDEEYYKELKVSKSEFENQSILVYPGKDIVAKSILEAQKHQ